MKKADVQKPQLEISHLKGTVQELRLELEKKNLEIERRVQTARQAAKEQNKQLEDTIDRMRIRLEEEYASRESQIQAETLALKDQLQQAQQTIIALREQLERTASK